MLGSPINTGKTDPTIFMCYDSSKFNLLVGGAALVTSGVARFTPELPEPDLLQKFLDIENAFSDVDFQQVLLHRNEVQPDHLMGTKSIFQTLLNEK